ncbi:unnamed protein product [Didymodactylos carnosus]|uniref:Uncharacterized protein n=1 Tax=Didymodactylos carnosus TaxID=1234261 RepID=A0A814V6F8_9BILA|nr:unnamed protein product [Didymodactylos carnosus]CAF1183992.1 unnamed protein product [Didymodactylos carnosus]CAF3505715.1 unnamed protein product [Didymodactylos carnosus]CAF3948293.1 unnamed protein product [Didymodactylos carnosus]
MECNKGPKKLWDRYIAKYGDFRNHIDAIRADYQCYLNFRIPFSCPSVDQCSKQKVQTKIAKATLETSFFKYNNRLPPKYCKYQQQHDNLSDTGIRTALITDNNDHIDIAQIKAIMRAEDFPDNLFSTTSERRPVLLKRQIGENYANCISASSSTQDARRSKTDLRSRTALLKHDVHEVLVSTVQHDNKTAAQPPSNKHISSDISEYSLSKSRKSIVELLPSTAIRPSQYRELFKKLNRNDEHHRISPNETHFSLTKNVMTSKNAKLSTAYSVKAFKDYLIQRSARLPKVSLFL